MELIDGSRVKDGRMGARVSVCAGPAVRGEAGPTILGGGGRSLREETIEQEREKEDAASKPTT